MTLKIPDQISTFIDVFSAAKRRNLFQPVWALGKSLTLRVTNYRGFALGCLGAPIHRPGKRVTCGGSASPNGEEPAQAILGQRDLEGPMFREPGMRQVEGHIDACGDQHLG